MSTATLPRPGNPIKGRKKSATAALPVQAEQRQKYLTALQSLEQVQSPSAMQVVIRVSEVLPSGSKASTSEVELELKALGRAFEFRRALLRDAITTAQVVGLLGISRQAVGERERKGQLLGVMEGGQLRFPLWQFDPAGSGGVVEGLPQVLRALDEGGVISPLAKMSWLRKANPSLGDVTPLEALRAARLTETLAAARGVLAS